MEHKECIGCVHYYEDKQPNLYTTADLSDYICRRYPATHGGFPFARGKCGEWRSITSGINPDGTVTTPEPPITRGDGIVEIDGGLSMIDVKTHSTKPNKPKGKKS